MLNGKGGNGPVGEEVGELEDAFWDGGSGASSGLHLLRDVKSRCRICPSIHRGGGWMHWEEEPIWRVVL